MFSILIGMPMGALIFQAYVERDFLPLAAFKAVLACMLLAALVLHTMKII